MSDKLVPKNDSKEEPSKFVRALSEPLSKYGWPVWLVYLLAVLGFIYLLNPGMGIIEFIPDNLPIIGNLDEGAAVMLVLAGIVEALEGRKHRQAKKDQRTPPQTENQSHQE